MKASTRTAILLIAAAFAASCRAQTAVSPAAQAAALPAPADSWSYNLLPAFVSQFMYRGQLLDGFSFQPTLTADYGNYEVGLWSNFPIQTPRQYAQTGPENDVFGSYSYSITDALSLKPGFLLYTYEFATPYRTTFEPSLALSYTVGGITLTPTAYYDVVLRGPTYELSASYAYPMPAFKTELDLLATVGTYLLADSSPDTRAWGNYWLVGGTLPFKVTESQKFSVGYAYTEGTDAFTKQGSLAKVPNTDAVGRGVLTVSYSIDF